MEKIIDAPKNNLMPVLQKQTTIEKNIGIDLLRILSTLMVVILHVLGHGSVMENIVHFSISDNLAWLLRIASFGAVNLFALITGYVYINGNHKLNKILELWLKVLFYSAGITVIFALISPSSTGTIKIIKSFLPVMTRTYWYFTSYFCLFMFIPFINALLKNISKENWKKLIIVSLFCFCGLAWIGRIFNVDTFNIADGFSFAWLICLYIVGAYLKTNKKDFEKYDKNMHLALYLISILVTFAISYIFQKVRYDMSGAYGDRGFFISYISPFIVFSSIQLFLYFSKLKINKTYKILSKISALSFGVYLISEHPLIRSKFITNKFINLASSHWITIIPKVLLASIIIFIICLFIESLRNFLFQKLHIKTLCEKIIDKLNYIKKFIKYV